MQVIRYELDNLSLQWFDLWFIVFVDYSTFRIYDGFLFKILSCAAEILI